MLIKQTNNKKRKITRYLTELVILAETEWKKERKKRKILRAGRELKPLWNMRRMSISIVIIALRLVPKSLEKGLEELETIGRIEIIHIEALLRLAKILRRALETWEDLLSLSLQRNYNYYHFPTYVLCWIEKIARRKIEIISSHYIIRNDWQGDK